MLARIFWLLFRALFDFVIGVLKTSALLLSLMIAALVAAITYDNVTCEKVASEERAIEIAREWILKNGLWNIRTVSGDWNLDATRGGAMLFDNSKRGYFPDCTAAPPLFHFANELPPEPPGSREVSWVNCERNFYASAIVTECGRVDHYRVDTPPWPHKNTTPYLKELETKGLDRG